jgi:hypothetical protein
MERTDNLDQQSVALLEEAINSQNTFLTDILNSSDPDEKKGHLHLIKL